MVGTSDAFYRKERADKIESRRRSWSVSQALSDWWLVFCLVQVVGQRIIEDHGFVSKSAPDVRKGLIGIMNEGYLSESRIWYLIRACFFKEQRVGVIAGRQKDIMHSAWKIQNEIWREDFNVYGIWCWRCGKNKRRVQDIRTEYVVGPTCMLGRVKWNRPNYQKLHQKKKRYLDRDDVIMRSIIRSYGYGAIGKF